jgi:hypothetical protein
MVAKIVNSMVTEITGDLKKVRSHEPREAAFAACRGKRTRGAAYRLRGI